MKPVLILTATTRDARRVLDNISDRTKAEYDLAGVDPAEMVSSAIKAEKRMYVSVSDEKYLTLFGFNDYGSHVSMWTIATPHFYDLGAPGVRETRRFFRHLDFGKPLVVVTLSPHPDVDRWMRLLGFQLASQEGFRKDFVYLPSS